LISVLSARLRMTYLTSQFVAIFRQQHFFDHSHWKKQSVLSNGRRESSFSLLADSRIVSFWRMADQ